MRVLSNLEWRITQACNELMEILNDVLYKDISDDIKRRVSYLQREISFIQNDLISLIRNVYEE